MAYPITKVIDLVPAPVVDLETVQASQMSAERFWTDYVSRQRPVLIRNAVTHWPAYERWSASYLIERLDNDLNVKFSRTFNPLVFAPFFKFALKLQGLKQCLNQLIDVAEDDTYSIPG